MGLPPILRFSEDHARLAVQPSTQRGQAHLPDLYRFEQRSNPNRCSHNIGSWGIVQGRPTYDPTWPSLPADVVIIGGGTHSAAF